MLVRKEPKQKGSSKNMRFLFVLVLSYWALIILTVDFRCRRSLSAGGIVEPPCKGNFAAASLEICIGG
jgi:hypothetical protein